MILSWPRRIEPAAGIRHQYLHVTDILPTLVDLIGLKMPRERNGLPADDLVGTTFVPTIDNPDAATEHGEQYLEVAGHRGYYRNGWEAVTFHEPLKPFSKEHWNLFDMLKDPTQIDDLSEEHPELIAELALAWENAAWANQVFPLDDGTRLQYLRRPPREEQLSRPVTGIRPGHPTLERYRSASLIRGRSFRVIVDLNYRAGDRGVLVAHGGQESGYVLYVEEGGLLLAQNAHGEIRTLGPVELRAPIRQIVMDVRAPGRRVWDITLLLDGEPAARDEGFVQLSSFLPYEGIDVGIDRRSPVSWDLYKCHGSFPFTGEIHAVAYLPGELAPDAGQAAIEEALRIGMGLE